jgi:hypothetical protein
MYFPPNYTQSSWRDLLVKIGMKERNVVSVLGSARDCGVD